jgi:tRNA1Val (adenine37-N6)-methyltransferase
MSIFQLQQFAINQSRSGMKICSDSLLFGALIPVDGAQRILDIGTGTGLLALMQAQKSDASIDSTLEVITAVEVTQAAAEEAQENFDNSPWSPIFELIEQDIQSFAEHNNAASSALYDLIICNPPFFAEQTKTASHKPLRHTARHTDTLSFQDLIHSIDLLLTATGSAFILLPVTALVDFSQRSLEKGFCLVQQIEIAETCEHHVKVALFEFKRVEGDTLMVNRRRINKFKQSNVHTDEVQALLRPFLLRYR